MNRHQYRHTRRPNPHRKTSRVGAVSLLAVIGCLLLLSSCAALLTQGDHELRSANADRMRDAAMDEPRVEQLGHGAHARFVVCTGAACPTPTRKTFTRKTLFVPPPAPKTVSVVQPPAPDPTSPPEPAPPIEVNAVVHFDVGQSVLSPKAKSILIAAVARVEGMPGFDGLKVDTLRVIGRTDSMGVQDVNDGLALARARVVRDYVLGRLHELPSKVELEAKGACCYAASNKTAGGRQINRRVELIFVRKRPSTAATSSSPPISSGIPSAPPSQGLSNSPPPDPPSDATPSDSDTADPIG